MHNYDCISHSGLAMVIVSFVAWTKLLYVEPG